MLKRSLIGLGIGLGVLAACFMLLVAGATAGGIVAYLSARYAAPDSPPQACQEPGPLPPMWTEPSERWRQWPELGPMPHEQAPDPLWRLVSAVRVTEVVTDSPADEAGVEVDDVIIAIDGIALDANHDLSEVIHGHDPGDEIALTIVRRGDDTKVFELEVTLGRNRDDEGEIVTYLGIWYRYLGAAVRALPPGEGSWD